MLVNSAARAAVDAAAARDFVALPLVDEPALVKLRATLEAGAYTRSLQSSNLTTFGTHCSR